MRRIWNWLVKVSEGYGIWQAFVSVAGGTAVMTVAAAYFDLIAQHGWGAMVFAGLTAVCVVILVLSVAAIAFGLGAMGYRLLRPLPPLPVTPMESARLSAGPSMTGNRSAFNDESVRVADLLQPGSSLLADKTFTRCVLVGPAVLKAQVANRFEFVAVPMAPDQAWTVLPKGSGLHATVLLSHVIFKDCFFDRISMVGRPEDKRDLLPAFHFEPRQIWEQRIGFGKSKAN